jgi:hypothetical protein
MTSALGERIVGIFIFLFASFILLPIPLSNFIPGVGILIISFGLIGKDGLVVISGMVVGAAGVAISVTTVLLGFEAFRFVTEFLF